jgi:hypothetical protein
MSKKNETECRVIIYGNKGKIELPSSEIIDFQSKDSLNAQCGSLELKIKGQKKEITDSIEPKNEIEVWVSQKGESHKLAAGYIDEIILEGAENSEETIQIIGRSYESILVDKKISGTISFENGYAQVIKKILEDTPIKEGNIQTGTEKGTINFRNISKMEIIQNIAEHTTWIFDVDKDKKAMFLPKLPERPAHLIKKEDIKKYKIYKQ